jgi:hypothetical protein
LVSYNFQAQQAEWDFQYFIVCWVHSFFACINLPAINDCC